MATDHAGMTEQHTPSVTPDTPEHICLQPTCCVDWSHEGRQWCEHDVWGDDCENHHLATYYVREDVAARHREQAQSETAALIRELVDALREIERRCADFDRINNIQDRQSGTLRNCLSVARATLAKAREVQS